MEKIVKEITEEQPNRFDEVMERVKKALLNGSLTIIDTWFQVTGKTAPATDTGDHGK